MPTRYKNDVELECSELVSMDVREIGNEYVIWLEIRSCKLDDEATIKMTARNGTGEVTTTANLKLLSEYNI